MFIWLFLGAAKWICLVHFFVIQNSALFFIKSPLYKCRQALSCVFSLSGKLTYISDTIYWLHLSVCKHRITNQPFVMSLSALLACWVFLFLFYSVLFYPPCSSPVLVPLMKVQQSTSTNRRTSNFAGGAKQRAKHAKFPSFFFFWIIFTQLILQGRAREVR